MTPSQKKDKQLAKGKEKVVDLEVEEGHGTKDVDAEGAEPITKDSESEKFLISTPLLLK